ncbi:MAG TPA: TetR/AcrR family transcriptional regulator [Candidatus Sulfotelmatobacter sp.]|nr:TetR/AcrR family transcriptional regulator [Candidatus Sulfotelmatobacter sp.]
MLNTSVVVPATTGVGLRERKKRATRRAISDAALHLALERGIDVVRVEDIAAAANVSTRTFNNYFRNKAEAIWSSGVDRAQRIGAALRARPADEPLWVGVEAVILPEYDDASSGRDPELARRRVLILTSSPALRESYLLVTAATQRALASAIAARMGTDERTDTLPEILAGAITAATQIALGRWVAVEPAVAIGPLMASTLRRLAAAWPNVEAELRRVPSERDQP